jgi:hypothetical protein
MEKLGDHIDYILVAVKQFDKEIRDTDVRLLLAYVKKTC